MASATKASPSLARRLLPKLAVSVAVGGVFAWLVMRGGVPLIPPAEAFEDVQWWGVAAYLPLLVLTHFLRAARWRLLVAPIKPLPVREVVALNWIGFFAIFALPLRLGEMVRPALTKLRNGIPVSAGLGTVAVERVVDGIVASACVAWALFALPRLPAEDPLTRSLPVYGYLSLAVFGGAFAVLALFLWKRRLAVRWTERAGGWLSPRLGRLLADKVGSVADGVRAMGDARLGAGFVLETSAYWATNAAGMWLLGWACGIPMGFGHAVAVMGILAIGILLPTGPGLFGNFQLAVSAALQLYFSGALVGTTGSVYIFLLYGIQAVFMVIAGVVPLYAMHISLGDVLRVSPAASDAA
ncbi:MAG: lysylphosphatidylglycerol synthase transmembrane domain-containing protein [Myxococcota bacterium]